MNLKLNTKPSAKEIRLFGITILVAFSIIASVLYSRGRLNPAYWMWCVSIPVGLLALLIPRAAWIFYVIWMGMAVIMGSIMSRVIMTVIYFLVISPVGLALKCTGRDALQIKKKSADESFWVTHKQRMDRRFYQRLF